MCSTFRKLRHAWYWTANSWSENRVDCAVNWISGKGNAAVIAATPDRWRHIIHSAKAARHQYRQWRPFLTTLTVLNKVHQFYSFLVFNMTCLPYLKFMLMLLWSLSVIKLVYNNDACLMWRLLKSFNSRPTDFLFSFSSCLGISKSSWCEEMPVMLAHFHAHSVHIFVVHLRQ